MRTQRNIDVVGQSRFRKRGNVSEFVGISYPGVPSPICCFCLEPDLNEAAGAAADGATE
jgi:hypothetical protein